MNSTRQRILVVDDCLAVCAALERRLQAAGYATATATDGSEALAQAARFRPDLILMDVQFPPDISQGGVAWDGFRIIDWMRYAGSVGRAPAIIITSDDVEQHRAAARAVGAVAVFRKPVSLSVLLETIADCLQPKPGVC